MNKKYYYIIYKMNGIKCTYGALIEGHPLMWKRKNDIEEDENIFLQWWQEIPKKIFDRYGGLEND